MKGKGEARRMGWELHIVAHPLGAVSSAKVAWEGALCWAEMGRPWSFLGGLLAREWGEAGLPGEW